MIENLVPELASLSAQGQVGRAIEAEAKILAGIEKLRERIDELGGYHDDV